MTTPGGLLEWGQAGQYNAVDDRAVITALADARNGIVTAAGLSAGSGLIVNIAAGWLAVANCGDGTCAVIGSRVALAVTVPAGPASGTLTSYIWADVNPDAAQYTVNVITPAQAAGRSGVQLGTVIANAGNNAASQMTLTASAPSFGNFDGLTIATAETGGTAYLYATKSGQLYVSSRTPNSNAGGSLVQSNQDGSHRGAGTNSEITARWSLPAADMVAYSHYRLWTSGIAHAPNPVGGFWFDVNVNGANYVRVTFASGTFPAGASFNFWIEGHCQFDEADANVYITMKVDCTSNVGTTFTGIATLANVAVPVGGTYMVARTSLGSQAGASCDTWSSVFQRFGGADPTAQISP